MIIKYVKTSVFLLFSAILLIFLTGCTQTGDNNLETTFCTADAFQCPDGSWVGRTAPDCEFICPDIIENEEKELKIHKFETDEELERYLRKQFQSLETTLKGGIIVEESFGEIMEDSLMDAQASPSIAFESRSEMPPTSAQDFSQTNVQEVGVDEGDIIKNDGKYIYKISESNFYIINAYPPEDMEIIYQKKVEGNSHDLILNEDRLAIIYNERIRETRIREHTFDTYFTWNSVTKIILLDIKNKSNPELIANYTSSGRFMQSRLVGENVFVVTNENFNNWFDFPRPFFNRGDLRILPDIYYYYGDDISSKFTNIISFNIKEKEPKAEIKSFLLGETGVFYMTENNIYIANHKRTNILYEPKIMKKRFYDVILPNLPKSVSNEILNLGSNPKWKEIEPILLKFYEKIKENKNNEILKKISNEIEKFDIEILENSSKTIIHRLSINDKNVEYETSGKVKGYLLNQFSMGEYEKHLRVATTFSVWTRNGRTEYNNVYVLNENMELVGKIEGIAPDERIYSARFMGDRLYMVTFREVDPFYVIDLKDPKNPEILGELKIPGFSNYLHPYDENHIIGIGKDTIENEWGGFTMKGMKISLFDVTDFNNPIEKDIFYIGDAGTRSIAEHDHRAVLFSKEKNLLAIPVIESTILDPTRTWNRKYWRGAYILNVDENGFSLRGKITHITDNNNNFYSYRNNNDIKRLLYMDNYLYSISDRNVKVSDINSLENINIIELNLLLEKRNDYDYYDYYFY